jgi:hypothetical protein
MARRTYAVVGIVALVGLSFFAAASPAYAANTLTVCASGCDATTIQDAVVAASAGDTIQVAAGTYTGLVTIDKAGLRLEGAQAGVDARGRTGAETIVTAGQFRLAADDITIDGFTFTGSQSAPGTDAAAIFGSGFQGTQIVDNIIQDNKIGAQFDNGGGTDPVLIQHNVFKDNNLDVPTGGTGILMLGLAGGSTNLSILDNDFSGDPTAAVNVAGHNVLIQGNTSTNDVTFVVVTASSDVTITQNSMTDGAVGSGIFLGLGNDGVTVSDNTLDSAATPPSGLAAIRVSSDAGVGGSSTNYTITGNVVTGTWSYSVRESAGAYTGPIAAHQNQFSAVISNEVTDPVNVIDASQNWWDPSIDLASMTNVTTTGACASRTCLAAAGPTLGLTGIDLVTPLAVGSSAVIVGGAFLLLVLLRRRRLAQP